jgi:hypothetical protein
VDWCGCPSLKCERGSWVVKGTEVCDLKESTGRRSGVFAAGLSNPSSFYLTYSIYGKYISAYATFYRTCVTAYGHLQALCSPTMLGNCGFVSSSGTLINSEGVWQPKAGSTEQGPKKSDFGHHLLGRIVKVK